MSAPPKKMGLSLYADLLKSDRSDAQSATISSAPVRYDVKKDGGDEEAQRKKDASLKFQPIKRPQVQQKARPKAAPSSSSSVHKFSSSVATASASSPDKSVPGSTPQQQPPSVQRSNFEDWVGDDDDDYYYQDRPRAKKKKKKGKKGPETRSWDWDDIYDPTLPNTFADYKGSEEQNREIKEWKARLYYKELKAAKKQEKVASDRESDGGQRRNKMFAPPSQLSFAPPSFDDDSPRPPPIDDDDDDYYPQQTNGRQYSNSSDRPFIPAQAAVPDDATGEDAYLRRMRMSGMVVDPPSPAPPLTADPAPAVQRSNNDIDAKRAEALAKIAAFKAKLAKPSQKADITTANAEPPAATSEPQAVTANITLPLQQTPPPPPPPLLPEQNTGVTISAAPVRYELPPTRRELDDAEDSPANEDAQDRNAPQEAADQPRTSRPGQKGFAERLLKKYGWEKGKGLGAQGEGITTALIGKADKRKKRSDADGGGWAQPANMGKIVGGKRRKVDQDSAATTEDGGPFGPISSVIKLEGMLTGLDIQREIEDNNLMQEIGDEMGNQYGNVERVFIWRAEMGGGNQVFVKFTSQLSALRAANGTDGMTFADNEVTARFWSEEMFEKGEYA